MRSFYSEYDGGRVLAPNCPVKGALRAVCSHLRDQPSIHSNLRLPAWASIVFSTLFLFSRPSLSLSLQVGVPCVLVHGPQSPVCLQIQQIHLFMSQRVASRDLMPHCYWRGKCRATVTPSCRVRYRVLVCFSSLNTCAMLVRYLAFFLPALRFAPPIPHHCHPRLDARGVRFGALSHVDHQNTAASPEPVPTSSTLHHRRSSPVQMDTTRTIMRGTVYHPQRGGNVTHRRSPVAYTQSPFQEAQMVFEFRKTHG